MFGALVENYACHCVDLSQLYIANTENWLSLSRCEVKKDRIFGNMRSGTIIVRGVQVVGELDISRSKLIASEDIVHEFKRRLKGTSCKFG